MTTLYYVMTNAGPQIWTYREKQLRAFWVDVLPKDDPAAIDIYNRDEEGEIIGYGVNSYDPDKATAALMAVENDTSAEPVEVDDIGAELAMCDYVISQIDRDDL